MHIWIAGFGIKFYNGQACAILANDLPWINLWQSVRYHIVSNDMQNVILIPAAGPNGAATANLLSVTVLQIVVYVLVRRIESRMAAVDGIATPPV